MSYADVQHYRARMTPQDLWPASHRPSHVRACLNDLTDPAAAVLTWAANDRHPHDDMLAAWLVLGLITDQQARATSEAHAVAAAGFLAAYRANPPQPSAETLADMRAAFGPGAEVVNVITGRRIRL